MGCGDSRSADHANYLINIQLPYTPNYCNVIGKHKKDENDGWTAQYFAMNELLAEHVGNEFQDAIKTKWLWPEKDCNWTYNPDGAIRKWWKSGVEKEEKKQKFDQKELYGKLGYTNVMERSSGKKPTPSQDDEEIIRTIQDAATQPQNHGRIIFINFGEDTIVRDYLSGKIFKFNKKIKDAMDENWVVLRQLFQEHIEVPLQCRTGAMDPPAPASPPLQHQTGALDPPAAAPQTLTHAAALPDGFRDLCGPRKTMPPTAVGVPQQSAYAVVQEPVTPEIDWCPYLKNNGRQAEVVKSSNQITVSAFESRLISLFSQIQLGTRGVYVKMDHLGYDLYASREKDGKKIHIITGQQIKMYCSNPDDYERRYFFVGAI